MLTKERLRHKTACVEMTNNKKGGNHIFLVEMKYHFEEKSYQK